jgi:hypothetical protein
MSEKEYLHTELLKMQSNQRGDERESHWSNSIMPSDHCFDRFLADTGYPVLLALLLGLIVALTASCTSTGGAVKAGLIAPVVNVGQTSANENDSFYQPPRNPGYNELTGS